MTDVARTVFDNIASVKGKEAKIDIIRRALEQAREEGVDDGSREGYREGYDEGWYDASDN